MTRILNTRPAPMGKELSQQLAELNMVSVDYPVIKNQAISCHFPSLNTCLNNQDCSWIFISKPAVLFFNQFLMQAGVARFTPKGKVFAVGKSTAQALESAHPGLSVLAPEQANSEALVTMTPLLKSVSSVLVKGVGGRGLIQRELTDKGVTVIELDLYQRVPQRFGEADLASWYDCKVVLATSVDIAKAVLTNVKNMVNVDKKHDFLQKSRWLVLSERIKAFLIQQGVENTQIFVCDASDNVSIIKLINELA